MGVHGSERDDDRDQELSTVARSLHPEWDSPSLWPSIAARVRDHDRSSAYARQLLHAAGAHFAPVGSFLKCVLVTKS